LAALDDFRDYGPLSDGAHSVESAVAMIQGLFGYGGPLEMMAAAQRAVELETDNHSPYHAIAHAILGHVAYILGDLEQAITPLRVASRSDYAPGIIRVLSLSIESFVEAERGDLARSRECAELAMAIMDARGLRASPQASLAFAALGQAQAAAGKVDDALETLELGLDLRRQSSSQGVWGGIHHLLVTARVAAQAGRFPMARDMLAELSMSMNRFSAGMAAMESRVETVRDLVRDEIATEMLNEPLTGRELDVLRLLQGSLSLHEIAVELYLSFNTVKTHARSVYRKLGAHSRGEAVRIGRRQSLI
jgi:LuxR family maltose regulon positive regulatory protein